jgi:hypothetical protein
MTRSSDPSSNFELEKKSSREEKAARKEQKQKWKQKKKQKKDPRSIWRDASVKKFKKAKPSDTV